MELRYAHEHTSCCNYAKANYELKDGGPAAMDHRLDKDTVFEGMLAVTELWFIMEGRLNATFDGVKNLDVARGLAVLIPVGSHYKVEAQAGSHIFICRVAPGLQLCHEFTLEDLYKEKEKVSQNTFLLPINERVQAFLELAADCIDDGLRCTKYLQMKVSEVMYLLRVYYLKEELAAFFYPILNNDAEFARIIMKNWLSAKNKIELASMTHLSPSRFGVKFKEVFGVSPYKWLLSRRSERIYHELIHGNSSFKEISEEFKFNSVQHFNDFCKKQFGMTPGQIRNSR